MIPRQYYGVGIIIILVASVLYFGLPYIRTQFFAPTKENGQKGVEKPLEQNDAAVVAENLEIPWEVAFLPNGDVFVTERAGRLVRISAQDKKVYTIQGVIHIGEGGLLGLVLHPKHTENSYIYLYLTTRDGGTIKNRVERYKLQNDNLTDRTIILDNIPGGSIHDGGRIAFGLDGYLYITTGETGQPNLSQDTRSLAGKILRIKDDGSIPTDNPFNNAVYSYGHRNSQGLAWDDNGQLWATEHGRSGVASGFDELNVIQKGKNYGWPTIEGDKKQTGMEAPVIHSGSDTTWAPAGAVYLNDSIFFAGLRGQALYEYKISEKRLVTHFKGEYGRLRAVALGPDGYLYVTTSNRDGRGSAKQNDDKILKINPEIFREQPKLE